MNHPSPTLAALSLTMLLPSLGTSIANVALPDMAAAFGATPRDVQWVVIAYLVTLTAAIVTAGRLGDRAGRRNVLLAGVVLFAVSSAGAALAQGLWTLVGLRALQGIAAAAIVSQTMALVGDVVPKDQTGRAMGLIATVSAVGTALGPSLGGALVAGFGWASIFIALAVVGLLTLVVGFAALPRDAAPRGSLGCDLPGTAILSVTLGAFALTTSQVATPASTAILAGLSIAGFAAFVRVERRATSPLVDLSLLKAPELSRGLSALVLVTTVVMATLVVGPFYLSEVLGLSPMTIGIVMSAGPVTAALSSRPAGGLIDRHGAGRIARIGLLTNLAGSVLMAVLPAAVGLTGYLGSLVLITSGYALFQTANNTAVMQAASTERRGLISALLGLARNLGLISGASGMGAIYGYAHDLVGVQNGQAGLTATFAAATLLSILATTVAWTTETSGQEAPRSTS